MNNDTQLVAGAFAIVATDAQTVTAMRNNASTP